MDEIHKYIDERYERWLDYSTYQCSRAGIAGEEVDVLNEVLCDLLTKPLELLTRLHSTKSGKYRELDYFVLRMILLNATSPTSPYRYRYKGLPVNQNVDYQNLDLRDVDFDNDDDEDTPDIILQKVRKVREVLDEINIDSHARKVFEYRFFHHEPFSTWEGPEDRKELYSIYRKVVELIKAHIDGEMLF